MITPIIKNERVLSNPKYSTKKKIRAIERKPIAIKIKDNPINSLNICFLKRFSLLETTSFISSPTSLTKSLKPCFKMSLI